MNDYRHQLAEGVECTDRPGKIVCVGRNYAEHAKELNNPIPTRPLLFIKPLTSAVAMNKPIQIPQTQGVCHHELEVAILISKRLKDATREEASAAIEGVGLGLDLTLRELQDNLKNKGQPWERAKAFDGACPLSGFVSARDVDVSNLSLQLYLNGVLQQSGNTSQMLFPVNDLLVEISHSFTLLPGDVVLTGTPAGVGPLCSGDTFKACLDDLLEVKGVAA